MQHKILITTQPAMAPLLEALAERLPVELDTEQLALLRGRGAGAASPVDYALSVSGHVVIRATVEPSQPGAAWLFIDGNRRNIKTAAAVCEAWSDAYVCGASSREPAEAQAVFERALVGTPPAK